MKKNKICMIASSGGHLEQLLMLIPLLEDNKGFIITEKTKYKLNIDEKIYYVKQVNRNEKRFLFILLINFFQSLLIYIKERPNVIISTGALSTIPMFILGKTFRCKLIFIESFAKINTPTKTGKLAYKLSDLFFVQWTSMLNIYPNARYIGGIY